MMDLLYILWAYFFFYIKERLPRHNEVTDLKINIFLEIAISD